MKKALLNIPQEAVLLERRTGYRFSGDVKTDARIFVAGTRVKYILTMPRHPGFGNLPREMLLFEDGYEAPVYESEGRNEIRLLSPLELLAEAAE